MQSHEWIELFKLIPADQHNQLVLKTNNGIELNIEILLRAEPGHVIFRGRVSGQNDDGRLFFLPYDNITYISVNRFVKEDEIRAILGPCVFGELTPDDPGATHEASSPISIPSELLAAVVGAPIGGSMMSQNGSMMSHPRLPVPNFAPPTPVGMTLPRVVSAPPAPPIPVESAKEKSSILERLRAQRNAMKGPKR